MHSRVRRAALAAAVSSSLAIGAVGAGASVGLAEDQPLPQATTHQHFDFFQGVYSAGGDGVVGKSAYRNPSSPICSTGTSSAANVNTDCEQSGPHNETSIAVNPTNGLNMIGGANDYQLAVSGGGTVNETAFARAHVTFDGGKSWATYPVPFNGYASAGDPALAFDADGRAYYATIGFVWSQGGPTGTNPDVLVNTSTDGGKTWSALTRVASGSGSWGSAGVFNDKEFVTAWGHGNAIVTWTVFNQGPHGSYLSSPIYDSVTHDGGRSWSKPQAISGSASFCVPAGSTSLGGACNQSQGSTPVVAADGSVYVSFLTTDDTSTNARDAYAVVKVDPETGAQIGGPWKVASLVDGVKDYPVNIDGRQTYQDSQFRTWSMGNLAADPTNAQHLAVSWSDMRNSVLPAPADPYAATTNSDVSVAQSFDGGATWTTKTITASGDQFMPWAAFGSDGTLHVGYFDRSYDSPNHKYGYTLATAAGSGFATTQATTELSDPTQGDRWFSGRTPNADFPHPTTFLGDYSGIAAAGTSSTLLWTDLRNEVTFGVRTGANEDAYFALK